MTQEPTALRVPHDQLLELCVEALRKVGVSTGDALTTVESLVTTETWGVHTHGTKLLPGYIKRLKAGGLRVDNPPRIASEGPAWALVDGGSSLGQVTSRFAMETAIKKARASGIGYAGVFNSCHFGAAGYWAWLAAKENMIGLSMANDWPTVAAPGSRKAITGSNPLAFAIPAGKCDPIMLDVSIAAVAGGKIYTAQRLGKSIPDNWIVGPDGLPTTDLSLFPEQAALQPMAGHKGYGLALLIESLAALLTGAAVTWNVGFWIKGDPSLPTHHGAAFLALDVSAMTPDQEFGARVDALIREIHEAPKAEGSDRIYLPGEMEWEKRRNALEEGVPLPEDVVLALKEMVEDLRLDAKDLFQLPV
jgi:LDH2 family malate/lactate/ureidoglycolate dehydrogenase